MKDLVLPSGAKMAIQVAPFATSKGLFQALLKELRGITVTLETANEEVLKNLFSSGLSSPEVEKWLWACLDKCVYDAKGDGKPLRINPGTFEDDDARQDFLPACIACARENILPFLKGLTQGLSELTEELSKTPASRPTTSPT